MITKAIIPAAGLGTRFLPQTKAMPKEMLPIIDKPIIQLVVEELVSVGVTDIIIVTGAQKRAIEDHFDRAAELEEALFDKGKSDKAEQIKDIAELANFVYVRQKGEPKGNARPILNASHLISNEPFFVFFPDDFFMSKTSSRAAQLLEAYKEFKSPVLSLIEVPKESYSRYGMVKPEEELNKGCVSVSEIIEKPEPENSPSNLASVGGYILTPEVLPFVENLSPGAGGEIVLADALLAYAQQSNQVVGCKIDGEYFDGGNKLGYLKAVYRAALEHDEFSNELNSYIDSLRDRLR